MNRTAIVTGASAGIGLEAARTLAGQGWNVIATGRNPERCAQAEAEIRAIAKGGRVHFFRADLSLMRDTARLAEDIASHTDSIDVLFNNAGAVPNRRELTAEGLEASFAGNHLGPFLLTQRLLPKLLAAASTSARGAVRIVNTSSDGSEYVPALDLDELGRFETHYANGFVYCCAKLANVLHAKALAERLAPDGIVAHSFHPGTPDTCFFANMDEDMRAHSDTLEKISLAEGADTMLWLATSDEAGRASGGYWYLRQPRKPNPVAEDASLVAQLWETSERLVERALGRQLT